MTKSIIDDRLAALAASHAAHLTAARAAEKNAANDRAPETTRKWRRLATENRVIADEIAARIRTLIVAALTEDSK